MKITESTRAIILSGLRKKGINQSELSEYLGHNKNWATRLFNGTLKTLNDDQVDKIIDYLDVSFVKVTQKGRKVSTLATRLSKASENDKNLSEALSYLADFVEDQNAQKFLPWIPTEDLVALGKECNRATHEDPDKDGKIGRIAVNFMAQVIERLNADKEPVKCTHTTMMEGCVSCGAPAYTGDVRKEICVDKEYPDDHFALQACGDSNEHDRSVYKRLPSIPDGSTIIVRKMTFGEVPRDGKLYVVSDQDGACLKLIKGDKLGSLNPKYKDFEPLDGAQVQAEFVEVLS